MTAAAGSAALASFGIRETSLCKSCTQCGFLSNNFLGFRDNPSGFAPSTLQTLERLNRIQFQPSQRHVGD